MTYLCPSIDGWGPLSPTHPTYLTDCFQYGALAIGINVSFLLAAVVRLRKHSNAPKLPSALVSGCLLWSKLLFTMFALFATAVELKTMAEKFPYVCVYTISLALQTVAVAVAIYLHYIEQFHNRIASTPLLLFWLGSIIVSLTRLRTLVLLYFVKDFYLQNICVALFTLAALVVFVLECQPKPCELFKQSDTDINDSGFGKPEDSNSDYCTSGSSEERANVFSQYTYTWVGSLLKKGYHKQLQLEDIWKLDGQYRPDIVNARFQRNWQKELRLEKPSLFRATVCTYWKIWALAAMHEVLRIIVTFIRIIIMSSLIGFAATYGTEKGNPIEYGYFYAIALFIVTSEQNVAFRQRWAHAQSVKTLVRTSYMTTIYQKVLTLSNDARQKHGLGSIVTHMSIDSENLTTFFETTSQDMWCELVNIIVALSMLYRLLGWSALAGVVIILACTPIMSRIGQIIGTRTKLLMSYRDKRMGIMNEVITGIRVVKMYAWELPFIKRINNVRVKLELDIISKNNVLSAILFSATALVPFMMLFVTFGTYSLFDNVSRGPLNAQLVFVGIPLLIQIRLSLSRVPQIIPKVSQAIASSRRITDFLTSGEIDFAAINCQPYNRNSSDSTDDDILVNIKGGSFKWSSAEVPAIRDINIQCRRSEMLAVIGRVGSGKSSLVSAILGDMLKCLGSASVCGSIAYVAQVPWILNATLRDNILFGRNYDQRFYNLVIDACALRQDVDALSAGDMSEIGERGINLSGGQKMRVSLARAVYARADVYILDDPLAAVDAHVSKHLFTQVLGPRGILRTRARILVTNAVQYLNSADNIVMLCDGRIVEQGSAAQAMEKKGEIFEFIHQHIDNQESTESSSTTLDLMGTQDDIDDIDNSESRSNLSIQPPEQANEVTTEPTELSRSDGKTTTTEFRRHGEVNWKTYHAYIEASGGRNVLIAAVAFFAALIGEACANLWLKHWTTSNTRIVSSNAPVDTHSSMYYILIYGAFGLASVIARLLMLFFIWSRCASRASTEVHQSMLTGVLRSPMSFFDTTPTGRILNRFSSDIQRCDETLPNDITMLLGALFNLFLAAIIVGISTPLILAVLPLLAIISYRYQGLYIRSSREIRRLDSTTRSPMYAHFQESTEGVSTIRAYRQQSRFITEMEDRIGQHIRVDNASLLLNQWLAMRLGTVGNTVTLGTALLALASMHYSGTGDANLIGLAIGSTFILSGAVNWGARHYSDMEVSMTHLERAAEYADLPSEADDIIGDHRPKDEWPAQGVVEFKNYSMRYRDGLDLVLKDLSFRVLPRQKVGIVGRTGAGKSSLTLALFRIIEGSNGQILLDGEDIRKYGLFDVRSKLSIIPQDPMLFAGTVRENLDPFGSYSDQDIWRVLEQAHLADYIRTKDDRLDFMVTQGGGHFSVGQRQLICLARALLKHAKVLVLDEATAAIDNTTDAIIQKTIRSEFKDCTVLTIAHRLDTVIDSDMILVINGGRLAEYDTPQNLLANKESIFSKLKHKSACRQRRRQVGVLTQALGQFVALKSSSEGWQAVATDGGKDQTVSVGGDIEVQVDRKTSNNAAGQSSDVYRMTASIPLEAGGSGSKDTQGAFSTYLSELRDWQAVLESPGIRQQWNHFVSSSTTVEMLDAHTSITQSRLRSPVPGQRKAFAHARDLLTVETSLVDPTTVVHIATSLPTGADDPAYLRPQPAVKRATSQLWAWCVEIATPLDALPALQQADDAQGRRARRAAWRACVRVTCFLHLELGSWQATNAAACTAAANLIPALVAYLRVYGAPPRVARAGPAISLDRCEWRQTGGGSGDNDPGNEVWELGYTVSDNSRTDAGAAQPQLVVSQILDEETMRQEARSGMGHGRKGSSLTAYLANSFQRQQGAAVALGTQAGGILRDGEALAVATMRAWLGGSMLELVVDAKASGTVDIGLKLDGFGSTHQFLGAIEGMQTAAPELFGSRAPDGAVAVEEDTQQHFSVAAVAARQLVQCFAVQSQHSGRRRLLVRIVHPPLSSEGAADATAYGVFVTVRSSIAGDTSQVRVNGHRVVTTPFALDAAAARRIDQSGAIKQYKADHEEINQPLTKNSATGSNASSNSTRNTLDAQQSVLATGVDAQLTEDTNESTPVEGTDAETTRRQSSGTASAASEVSSQTSSMGGALQRLQLVCNVAADEWTAAGVEGSMQVQIARAEVAAAGGLVLRGTALVEGWTEFDVAAVVLGDVQASGLWAARHDLASMPDGSTLHHCSTNGSWGIAARDAVVARAWRNGHGRIDIAECSADSEPATESTGTVAGAPADVSSTKAPHIRAELGLSGWVLTKAAARRVEPQRERSASTVDNAEVDAQRRRQPAVRITHYLAYQPRGWLDSSAFETALRKTGAALGITAPMPAIPPPGLRAALVADVTSAIEQLNRCGAPPAVMWTRNARVIGTATGEQLEYRLTDDALGSDAVEAELRIEHRVWAHGGVARQAAARVTLTIAPFSTAAAVACFVDPHGDPHATRVRISHPRAALLPRIEETDDGVRSMAWPAVRIVVSRTTLDMPPEPPARVAPWSVPPRLLVNGVAVRVRYQRRGEPSRGFYTRCQSVPPHRVTALARTALPNAIVREPVQSAAGIESIRTVETAKSAEAFDSHMPLAIQRYSVRDVPSPVCRVAGPPQFAAAVAACFARIRRETGTPSAALDVDVPEVHADIPTTVGSAVFPGITVTRLAALLAHPAERRRWDHVLFGRRRELEHMADGAQHATVVHATVRVPPLCARRDALTVCTAELAPSPGSREPTLTLVEASVPGAQPRESVARAHIALYGVFVEPVEPSPSCRVTVACCLDLAGAIPLPLRCALSARVPKEHLAQLQLHAALPPVSPWLETPTRLCRRLSSHGDGGAAVAAEAHLALVDSRPFVFYCDIDAARIVCEDFRRDGVFSATVRAPPVPPEAVAANVTASLVRLRKSGVGSVSVLPVVSDVVVDMRGFPCGVDVLVHVDGSPLSEHVTGDTADLLRSAWISPASDAPRLAVYVFARPADHSAQQTTVETYLIRVVRLSEGCNLSDDEEEADFDIVVSVCAAEAAAEVAPPVLPPVVCNGQRLRVHSAQPAHQSLLFVDTTDGEFLAACLCCGCLGCAGCNPSEDAASNAECSGCLAVDTVATTSFAQSSVLRCRIPSGISSADSGSAPSQRPPAVLASDDAAAAHHRPLFLSLIRSLAVFLPIRRLVIGQTRLVEHSAATGSGGPRIRRRGIVLNSSTLALAFVLLVGLACACLGLALANCTYAA
ncbi:hypothetical protein H4R24_003603 [Coemansia sp. RSA 988]|nr:hypothetical protein H4R24_003603 [Coemansia sp. RSA 988]